MFWYPTYNSYITPVKHLEREREEPAGGEAVRHNQDLRRPPGDDERPSQGEHKTRRTGHLGVHQGTPARPLSTSSTSSTYQ